MTALLAIDPGSFTGWAVGAGDAIMFGTWKLRLTLRGGRGGRLLQLEQHIEAANDRHALGRVVFEEPYVGRFAAPALSLGGMVAVVQLWAARRGVPCHGFQPREIKAGIASGRASKAEMIARVRALGYPVEDEHQADAVALALLALSGAMPAAQIHKEVRAAKKRGPDLFGKRRAA